MSVMPSLFVENLANS